VLGQLLFLTCFGVVTLGF